MGDFNIKDVDFYNLDIDKYLDWLLEKYKTFSGIRELPYLDDIITNLVYRNYVMFSHYLATRSQKTPEKIETLYQEKIEHFEKQKEKYKSLIHELIFFESVKFERKTGEIKKYGFFSKEELENIKIETFWLNFWLVDQREKRDSDLIDEINERKKASPLKELAFYQKELDNLLQDYEFKYLEQILEGAFIYNLDNLTVALSFSAEIDRIRQAIYLSEMIKGDAARHPLTKPLKWKGNINSLATLFIELSEKGIIEGSKENIKRLLLNNFVNSDNQQLSKFYLDDVFKPTKGKTDAKTIENLKSFLSYLTENRPDS